MVTKRASMQTMMPHLPVEISHWCHSMSAVMGCLRCSHRTHHSILTACPVTCLTHSY